MTVSGIDLSAGVPPLQMNIREERQIEVVLSSFIFGEVVTTLSLLPMAGCTAVVAGTFGICINRGVCTRAH
jgi:hypothetical protein